MPRCRLMSWFSCLLACLLTACPHRAADQNSGLPPEWPLPQLTLSSDAQVFEGDVDTKNGGTAVTVFYIAASGWAAQLAHVEARLGPLHYRVMPEAAADHPAGGQHRAWAAPDGKVVVFLAQETDPEAQKRVGQAGYFTLLAKRLDQPLAVDRTWPEI